MPIWSCHSHALNLSLFSSVLGVKFKFASWIHKPFIPWIQPTSSSSLLAIPDSSSWEQPLPLPAYFLTTLRSAGLFCWHMCAPDSSATRNALPPLLPSRFISSILLGELLFILLWMQKVLPFDIRIVSLTWNCHAQHYSGYSSVDY